MTGKSNVTEEQCENRQDKVFALLTKMNTRLARIEGRIGVTWQIIPNAIALGAFIIATMALTTGGCTVKKKTQLDNVNAVDTIEEFAQLKREITAMVKTVGVDRRLEITGDHTYHLEADGTLWLQHGDQRRATNTWREGIEWTIFREDLAHNHLRERIQAFKRQPKPTK